MIKIKITLTLFCSIILLSSCFYPFYKLKEIEGDFIYVVPEENTNNKNGERVYHYFAESLNSFYTFSNLKYKGGYKYEPSDSLRHYYFLSDPIGVLKTFPDKPKIKDVRVSGKNYTRYRYFMTSYGMDYTLDIFAQNDTIRLMEVKIFNE